MNFKKPISIFLISLMIAYFIGVFGFSSNFWIYLKPILIPVFLVYAAVHNQKLLSTKYLIFVLFFYLSEITMLYSEKFPDLLKFSLILSFCSYMALINLAYPLIKKYNVRELVKFSTFFVIFVNLFILFYIVTILLDAIYDKYVDVLVIFNAISAVLLILASVILLTINNNLKNLYYFFGAFFLLFSDIFSALVAYYFDNITLNFLERLLHFAGFYLIYLFLKEKNIIQEEN